jgi:hypothetical protein
MADGFPEPMLVALTAACFELKKQVQYTLTETVNFMRMYIALLSKLVYAYKIT